MSPEDMQRYGVVGRKDAKDLPYVEIACDRCDWFAELDMAYSLAELVRRAEEHGEVCR